MIHLKEKTYKQFAHLERFLESMSDDDYKQTLNLLSGSSVGQHVRHIIEFYLCLFNKDEKGLLSYDKRKRDLKLEQDKKFALDSLNHCQKLLDKVDACTPLTIQMDDTIKDGYLVETTLRRELVYCLDHMIHHLAQIRIAAKQHFPASAINEDFGVANATLAHRKGCAQ